GSEKETITGCGATSMNGSTWMSVYPSSMSTGMRLMLTAAGRTGACRRKQSGRWRRVRNHRRMVLVYQSTSDDFPGAKIRLRCNVQILIGEPWDAFQSMLYRQVIAGSDAGKCSEMYGNGRRATSNRIPALSPGHIKNIRSPALGTRKCLAGGVVRLVQPSCITAIEISP